MRGGFTYHVKLVNIISSHVWSPHHTSLVASGFDLFAGELSYHAEARDAAAWLRAEAKAAPSRATSSPTRFDS